MCLAEGREVFPHLPAFVGDPYPDGVGRPSWESLPTAAVLRDLTPRHRNNRWCHSSDGEPGSSGRRSNRTPSSRLCRCSTGRRWYQCTCRRSGSGQGSRHRQECMSSLRGSAVDPDSTGPELRTSRRGMASAVTRNARTRFGRQARCTGRIAAAPRHNRFAC